MNPPSLLPTSQVSALRQGIRTPLIAVREARSLLDLMYEGLFVVFMLNNGHRPSHAEHFKDRVRAVLGDFERGALALSATAEDVHACKFAYCALIDETMLAVPSVARDEWEQSPLQLELFGEQLAGERFFQQLEQQRSAVPPRVQVLEVFHMCLRLGFRGQYALDGSEKLHYLTARLSDEIAHIKGKRASFAPHWAPPDQILNTLRNEVPLWVLSAVFAVLGLVAYAGVQWTLSRQTAADLEPYHQIVGMPTKLANVTITLP
jgi:type VI secretion system protein ImpK